MSYGGKVMIYFDSLCHVVAELGCIFAEKIENYADRNPKKDMLALRSRIYSLAGWGGVESFPKMSGVWLAFYEEFKKYYLNLRLIH